MRPIEGHPGLYRLDHGGIVSTRDMEPFESSDLVTGIRWHKSDPNTFIFQHWYFTCAVWPKNSDSVQQVAHLYIGGVPVASAVLLSLLTCVDRPSETRRQCELKNGFVERTQEVGIELAEQPVEGAGLRVHFRGYKLARRP